VDETGFHKDPNGTAPPGSSGGGSADRATEAEPLRPERGRVFFSIAWTKAANEGLISEKEYLTELTRHSRAENIRTIPGIPWRRGP